MGQPPRHAYVFSHGPQVEPIERALVWLDETRFALGRRESWIATFTKEVVRHGPFTEIIGTAIADDLYHGRPVERLGTHLKLVTAQTVPARGTGAPVLALYADEPLLELLDDLPNGGPIVVLPWRLREVRDWIVRADAQLLLLDE